MIHQQITGSGKTIVFLHGSSQSLTVWDDVVTQPALANFKKITIDLPGHGLSAHSINPESDYTLKGMAQLLKKHLKNITEEYVVVASSLATNFISEIILELSQCKGVVLAGSSAIGSKVTVSQIVQPSPYFAVTFTPNPTDNEIEGLVGTLAVNMPDDLRCQCIEMFKKTDPKLREQMGKSIAEGDWSDEIENLERFNKPVAILYGKDEKIVFPDYLTQMAIKMWRGGVIEIADAGHCCQFDAPEEFACLVGQYAEEIFR